jgi:hypothetical protein
LRKRQQRHDRRLGEQDKSTGAGRHSSPCLHIQKIAPTCATMSPNSAQRQHRFVGTTFKPHAPQPAMVRCSLTSVTSRAPPKAPSGRRAVPLRLGGSGPQCRLRFHDTVKAPPSHQVMRARLLGRLVPSQVPAFDRRSTDGSATAKVDPTCTSLTAEAHVCRQRRFMLKVCSSPDQAAETAMMRMTPFRTMLH